MKKDICCIGHITKDKIVTPRQTVYMAGGTSFYFAYALNSLPKKVTFELATKLGADEMGVYHREVLRFGVLTCTLTYSYLDNADCSYLLGLLQNKTTFQFTCPVASDSTDVTQTITRTCYCSNYGAALQRLKAGVWRDMTLEIKEC